MLEQDRFTGRQDSCLNPPSSMLRFGVLALLFFTLWSSLILLALLADRPYEIQLSSMAGYTAAVAFFTFSRNRYYNQQFLLSCPVVRSQLPQLIRRHLGFLVALFIVQTTAIDLRPNLPAHWIRSSRSRASPFILILSILCACLVIVQTRSNRALLDRAHRSAETQAAIELS